MSQSISISGTKYTVTGTVTNEANQEGVVDLHVLVYDRDLLTKDDFLGIAVTGKDGSFSLTFDKSQFQSLLDRRPDLYFIVKDAGLQLLDTKDDVIRNADESTPPIKLEVSLKDDDLRKLINPTPAPGWVGGFEQSNPDFAYPDPDLNSLPMLDNMDNIKKLQRQQKVVWPEFSWLTVPGEADSRCYQMFAPDISRLGYTNEGRVFSIICPQQGACASHLGCMNVEVTVTGNRGWADEDTKEIAADMTVLGKIWFSPSAHENNFVKQFGAHFDKHKLPFPWNKANAIVVETFKPGTDPSHPIFPLTKGSSSDFKFPDFARHDDIAWSHAHLGVEIGPIKKHGIKEVDEFNQFVLDVFNIASGNMLKEGNTLTWNVWFTAPELVDTDEWQEHAEKWRESIDADHGSPEGPGTDARYFDGTPFKPLEALVKEEYSKIIDFVDKLFT